MHARVFLRQPLFTFPGAQAHVPTSAVVLEGECTPMEGIGLKVVMSACFDEKGKALEVPPLVLVVSAGKIDHLQILD